MSKIRITSKEKSIIKAIIAFGELGKRSFTIDEVADRIYNGQAIGARSTHWRSSLASTLRNLGYKVEQEGYRLRRISDIGRSAKAEYEFAGQFERLINKP